MIYTVTLNPSLDYIVSVEDFKTGFTNRTDSELLLPGGKGINISIVLKNLGIKSTALGFAAGFTGVEFQRRLEESGIKNELIFVKNGCTRINVKLKSIDGTEINGRGPEIPREKIQELMEQLTLLKTGDVLFLSGSVPAPLSDNTYGMLMEKLRKGVLCVVDAEKKLLMNTLPYHPFLIKPNLYELSGIFDVELNDRASVVPYAKKLQEMGARNVLVSMSGLGAVLAAENGSVYEAAAPKGVLVNAVGAGDSMTAGFMAGWLEKQDYEYAFHRGLAAGSASAFSEYLATKEEVEHVYRQIISV